ncbi:MAG: YdiU family protein, partial [Algicola sp.]|nr:YdiU family protein [Algicola sp.]
ADGLAVLRSSIREFLCSEAMYHLGVPTTRALSLVLTGEEVVRDMFYDGNPQYEPTAVVCRTAPSFIRFGNFQILSSRGEIDELKQLVDFTITNDFPHLGEPCKAVYLEWFKEVSERTADMVAHWMRVGFVHGVMNTDNLSIMGLTIDYGPYGWLEDYDPGWTPNTTDAQGKRYCYANQPKIAQWNLYQLANAIVPLIEETEGLEALLQDFTQYYQHHWLNILASKVGFEQYNDETDNALLEELLALFPLVETDMTIFYRHLANLKREEAYNDEDLLAVIYDAYYQPETLDEQYKAQMIKWLRSYQARIAALDVDDEQRKIRMNKVNPKYVLRNYIAQQAIDKAHEGDYAMVNELLDVMRKPYDDQPQFDHYAAKRPEWARVKAGCSMLSCSS